MKHCATSQFYLNKNLKMKKNLFLAIASSIILFSCTTTPVVVDDYHEVRTDPVTGQQVVYVHTGSYEYYLELALFNSIYNSGGYYGINNYYISNRSTIDYGYRRYNSYRTVYSSRSNSPYYNKGGYSYRSSSTSSRSSSYNNNNSSRNSSPNNTRNSSPGNSRTSSPNTSYRSSSPSSSSRTSSPSRSYSSGSRGSSPGGGRHH